VRLAATIALKRIEGKAPTGAVQAVLDALRNPVSSDPRVETALALAELGDEARATLPLLQDWLEDSESLVRVSAAAVVWQLSKDRTVLPVLRRGLESGDARTRKKAAETLAEIGPPAKSVATVLKELLEDAEGDVRSAAAAALQKVE
jgi:HEAT repeat protein